MHYFFYTSSILSLSLSFDKMTNNNNKQQQLDTMYNNNTNSNNSSSKKQVENGHTMTRMHPSMKRPRAPIACYRCHHKKVT
jgi:hypothetical protein